MHLFDSVLKMLQFMRDSFDFYCYKCKEENRILVRFPDIPHEVITHLLYSIRFEKSDKCDLNFLFLEFIRLGYNPFRPDATYKERIMIKSVIQIIDKLNGHKYEGQKKNK